jgi:hypothetical protein
MGKFNGQSITVSRRKTASFFGHDGSFLWLAGLALTGKKTRNFAHCPVFNLKRWKTNL